MLAESRESRAGAGVSFIESARAPRGRDYGLGQGDGLPRRLASRLRECGMTRPRDGAMGFSAPTGERQHCGGTHVCYGRRRAMVDPISEHTLSTSVRQLDNRRKERRWEH